MSLSGFVDLQVNGFRGTDFSAPDLDEGAAVDAVRNLVADGTAVLLPTLITCDEEVYARNLPLLCGIMARPEFAAHLPGFHLEGPFLCPHEGVAGAHDPQRMRAADGHLLDRLQAWAGGRIRLLTVAPDIPGACALIQHARALGMIVAAGHHFAGAAELAQACAAGASMHTHLGNGLPHRMDRHANPLIAALAEDGLAACVIGDGHHLPWPLLKVILRCKGIDRCALVSDASPLAGLHPGRYRCFGRDTEVTTDGRVRDPSTGYLAGSGSTLRQVVNATRAALGLDDDAMARLAIATPLRLLGDIRPAPTLPRACEGVFLPPGR